MTYIYIRLLWENPHRENVQHDKGKSRCDAGKTPTSTERMDQQVSSEKDRKFYRSWWQLLLKIVSYAYITLNNHTRNNYSDMIQ